MRGARTEITARCSCWIFSLPSGKVLENLAQPLEVELWTAYIEVNRTKQKIGASRVTRMFNEEEIRTDSDLAGTLASYLKTHQRPHIVLQAA